MRLKNDDRLRHLGPRTGIDFSSNDYLALASAPHMKKAIVTALEAGTPIGAGGSRLLRGNCEEHGCVEAAAARFFGAQTVPFFGRGYTANFAVLTTLPHATTCSSLIPWFTPAFQKEHELAEPSFESAPVTTQQVIESAICDWRAAGGARRVWIVVESLYSMDGDFTLLEDLLAIADRHVAFLVVDEAHATGVYGEQR